MPVPAELPISSGRYLAAVSGGADSVALLLLAFGSVGHVAHVHHELRGPEADGDAAFVRDLCRKLGVTCSVVRRSEVAGHAGARTAGQLRAMRLAVYQRCVAEQGLNGVLLGHHADDQAETVLLRLMRSGGRSVEGVVGMRAETRIGRLRLVRPLLGLRRETLLDFLRARGQSWREDASNRLPHTPRNRLRVLLAETPGLTEAALAMSEAAWEYREGLGSIAGPVAGKDQWRVGEWGGLPGPIARTAVRMLLSRRLPPAEVTAEVVGRLLTWSQDAALPRKLALPGGWTAVRSRGWIEVVPPEDRGRGGQRARA